MAAKLAVSMAVLTAVYWVARMVDEMVVRLVD